jgi:hypothetical protein
VRAVSLPAWTNIYGLSKRFYSSRQDPAQDVEGIELKRSHMTESIGRCSALLGEKADAKIGQVDSSETTEQETALRKQKAERKCGVVRQTKKFRSAIEK